MQEIEKRVEEEKVMTTTVSDRPVTITTKQHPIERLVRLSCSYYGDLNEDIQTADTPEKLFCALSEGREGLELRRNASKEGTPLRERLEKRYFLLSEFIHCNFDGIL
jgi:hypothetical protein